MARVLPEYVADLEPLADVAGTLVAFARDPYGFIKSRIAVLLVTSALTVIEVITGKVRALWGIIADAVIAFGDSVGFGFANAGASLLDALDILPGLLTRFASPSGPLGPLAPVVVGIGGALLLYGTWQALKRTPKWLWIAYQIIPGT